MLAGNLFEGKNPAGSGTHAFQPEKGTRENPMTRFSANADSKHDSVHALAAEQHTHAAYEHWAAHYRQNNGEINSAQDFGRAAHKHSMKAAELSTKALRQGQSTPEPLTVAAD
jgi:hypothetical protein